MVEKTTEGPDVNFVKWLPWVIQFAILVWGAAGIKAKTDTLAESVIELRTELKHVHDVNTALQIQIAELTVEINALKAVK